MKFLAIGTALLLLVGGFTYLHVGHEETGALRLTGVLSANEVIVAAKMDGRIQSLHVNEGSWVERNGLIAELERQEIEPEQERQVAAVHQQAAKLTQSQEQLRLDRDRVRTQIAGAQAQLQLAQSLREESRTELGQLQRDFERSSDLVRQGLLARQEAEKVETSLRVAEARIRSLDDRVRVAQTDLELARANERQVAVTVQEVEQIRAQRDQAAAQLTQTTARLGYTEVRAPLSGIVSLRVARQGEVIRQGDPIVTIIDLDDVWVRAEVEESYMNRVLVGQVLPVRRASGEEVQGRVSFIAPETDFATQRDVNRAKRDIRTFGIKVALANPEHRLHSGMTAYVMLPATAPAPVARSARRELAPPPSLPPASLGDPGVPAAQARPAAVTVAIHPRPAATPAAPPPAIVGLPPPSRPALSVTSAAVSVPSLPVTRPAALAVTLPPSGAAPTRPGARSLSETPMTSIGMPPPPTLPKALVPALPVTVPAASLPSRNETGLPSRSGRRKSRIWSRLAS